MKNITEPMVLPRLRSADGYLVGAAYCGLCDCDTLHAYHRADDLFTCAECDTILHCDYCTSPVHGAETAACQPCGVEYLD